MPKPSMWLLTALAACGAPDPDGSGAPALRVDSTLLFDGVDIGTDEPAVAQVWVENVGHGTLFVEAPYFAADGAFSVSGESVALERMEAHAYDVTFDPQVPFEHEGSLVFESDDPNGPLRVDVRGEGFAPVLDVSTSPLDFGMLDLGCGVERVLELHNGGNELLVVQAAIDDPASTGFGVPKPHVGYEIEPGDSTTIDVFYAPADGGSDSTTLTLESNDPLLPEIAIDVTGAGQELLTRTDLFEMAPRVSDIVFIVDNSETMIEDRSSSWTR